MGIDELIEPMKTAFAAGISWERSHFVMRGEASPDIQHEHDLTLLSFCLPGQIMKQETRRYVLECLKTSFRKGQEIERELRERAKVL